MKIHPSILTEILLLYNFAWGFVEKQIFYFINKPTIHIITPYQENYLPRSHLAMKRKSKLNLFQFMNMFNVLRVQWKGESS